MPLKKIKTGLQIAKQSCDYSAIESVDGAFGKA
jgi:hypothetical protein